MSFVLCVLEFWCVGIFWMGGFMFLWLAFICSRSLFFPLSLVFWLLPAHISLAEVELLLCSDIGLIADTVIKPVRGKIWLWPLFSFLQWVKGEVGGSHHILCLQQQWFLAQFFFIFFPIFFWLRWVFIAVCGLSLVAASGGSSSLRCAASHRGGFSCCGAWALGMRASVVVARGLSSCGSWALEHRLSSCGAWA